jgi:iron complex outermembrane receptor protein
MNLKYFTTCSIGVLALLMQGTAHAAPADEPPQVDEIVVTGSRIATDGFQSATPLVSVSERDLQVGATTVFTTLEQMPQFRNSNTTRGNYSTNGTPGAMTLNLRNLGSQRTLVLINGNRAPVSNDRGSVDVGLIPSLLISGVDVITGGASAAYGSDAVAGAVNFKLNTGLNGIKGEIAHGTSTFGDGDSNKAGLAFGSTFADGRGHIVVGADYFHQQTINGFNTKRDWFAANPGIVNTTGGVARTIFNSGVTTVAPAGGLITGGPLNGLTFNAAGNPIDYNLGAPADTVWQNGTAGVGNRTPLLGREERYTALAHLDYDLTDNLRAYGELSYGKSKTLINSQIIPLILSNAPTIFAGNAFATPALQARITAAGVTSFGLQRIMTDVPTQDGVGNDTNYRALAGVSGNFTSDWSYKAYVQYSRSEVFAKIPNDLNWKNFYAAVDAVRDPATGQIVCRSTLQGLTPGCVPMNLFGAGAVSAAAWKYAIGPDVWRKQTIDEWNVGASTQRSLFTLAAKEPAVLAVGYEFRGVSSNQTTDPLSRITPDYTGIRGVPTSKLTTIPNMSGGYIPYSGDTTSHEGFAELNVPLISDAPMVYAASINGAVRYTAYDPAGNVVTYKFSANYQPIQDIRLRGSISRDIRAPAPLDLFQSESGQGSSTVTINGKPVQTLGYTLGNPNLAPEKAKSYTFGVVYQPQWLPGLSASADYYNIKLSGGIGTAGTPQALADACTKNGSAFACSTYTIAADGGATFRIPVINNTDLLASGMDYELSYARDLGEGRLSLHGLATYTDKFISSVVGAPRINRAGQVGNSRWVAFANGIYSLGPLTASLGARFISKSLYDVTFVEGKDINDNHVPSAVYVDAAFMYDFGADVGGRPGKYQAFLNISNLLHKDPPLVPMLAGAISIPTATNTYDLMGRYFTAGLRFNF